MEFKVGTFNILNYTEPPEAFYECDNIYSLKQWESKESWIGDMLQTMNCHIVGFQEVFSPSSLQDLCSQKGLPYFGVVDKPQIRDDYIFESPVVALGSQYPILSLDAVVPDKSVIKDLQIRESFTFSRVPLKALVDIKGFTPCLVYVVHLKSKRPHIQLPPFKESMSLTKKVEKTLLAHIHGDWASTIQRGTEAALVFYDIMKEIIKSPKPVIVLGDLNDNIDSATLTHITKGADIRYIDGVNYRHLPHDAQQFLENNCLEDAFHLCYKNSLVGREYTHFYGSHGDVLDYVLLSRDFNPNYSRNLGDVIHYKTYNEHLIHPHRVNDYMCSDHAPVVAHIETRG